MAQVQSSVCDKLAEYRPRRKPKGTRRIVRTTTTREWLRSTRTQLQTPTARRITIKAERRITIKKGGNTRRLTAESGTSIARKARAEERTRKARAEERIHNTRKATTESGTSTVCKATAEERISKLAAESGISKAIAEGGISKATAEARTDRGTTRSIKGIPQGRDAEQGKMATVTEATVAEAIVVEAHSNSSTGLMFKLCTEPLSLPRLTVQQRPINREYVSPRQRMIGIAESMRSSNQVVAVSSSNQVVAVSSSNQTPQQQTMAS